MQSLPSPLLSGPSHNRCQVRGVAYRTRSHYSSGDPSGIVLFGFPIEQVGNFLLRPAIHNFVCSHFVSYVHAHVQRTRLAKRETPRGLIKLHARNSQVGQDPVHPGNPQPLTALRNLQDRPRPNLPLSPKPLNPLPPRSHPLSAPSKPVYPPGVRLRPVARRLASAP